MTDDAELRARIEAQVAARRAGSSSAKDDKSADKPANESVAESGDEALASSPGVRGPSGLAPTRPWSRSTTPPAPPPTDAPGTSRPSGPLRPWQRRSAESAAEERPEPPEPSGGRSGLSPARPWRTRGEDAPADEPAPDLPAPSNPEIVLQSLAAEVALPEPPVDEPVRGRGRSHPVSNPPTGRRRRLGRGEPLDEPGADHFGEAAGTDLAAEAPSPPAAYVPDAATVAAYVEAAGPVLEAAEAAEAERAESDEGAGDRGKPRRERRSRDKRARRGRGEPAAPPPVESAEPDLPAAYVAPAYEPPAEVGPEPVSDRPVAVPAAATPYPWQQPDAPDLDRRGAPTWDPADDADEASAEDGGRGKRALRWLLARAPEPEAEPETEPESRAAAPLRTADVPPERATQPVAEPVFEPQVVVEPEPVAVAEPATVAVIEPELAPAVAEPREAATAAAPSTELSAPGADLARRLAEAAAADAEDPPLPFEPKRPLLTRLFRRREELDEDDEPYEKFTLPEPDAAFERPWLRPSRSSTPPPPAAPTPTREWRRERAVVPPVEADAPGAAEATIPQPTPEPMPVPTPEPMPQPTPEPMPEPMPEPEPVPEPTPEPAPTPPPPVDLARQRPKPGSRPRPTPGRVAVPPPEPAAAAAVEPAAPERPVRSSLGIAGATERDEAEKPAAHRAGDGISGASQWGVGASRAADIARLLETPEPPPTGTEAEPAATDGGKPRIPQRARRLGIRLLVVLLIAAIATLLLRAFVVQPYYIPSPSMEPTLHGCTGCNDDHVLVDKISYRAHDVRAGDIVVFHRPANAVGITDKVLIKRVVALSGDVVELRKGKVYVNGLVLDEPYINKACGLNTTTPLTGTSKWRVPANDVFVLGDNRCPGQSEDSRMFGPIAKSSIIGRAFAIIWPLGRIRLL